MMKKLEFKQFNKMSEEQMRYISWNAMLCLDYMILTDGNKPTELLCTMIEENFNYLSNLKENSIEYLFARYSWALEILEGGYFRTQKDFYDRLKDTLFIDRDLVPNCIKEAVKAITNENLHKEIYDVGEMVYEYNQGRLKFLELYPCDINDISNLLDIETQEDGLRELGIVEDSTLETFTVSFTDTIEADIKICSGQSNCFIDPVLFNDGHEVCVLDCEGDFYSGKEFEFKNNDITYTVVVYDKLTNLENDIINSLKKYDSENIDIVNEEDTSQIYLAYHSKHDSFSLGKTIIDYTRYTLAEIETLFTSLNQLADRYDLGTVGI